jgi:enoyl-CoA hydratase
VSDFFWQLSDDRETRVVVVRGAGRAFCAGLDLKEQGQGGDPGFGTVQGGLRGQREVSEIVMLMRRAPQPIIAAVHGPACGGGFAMALAADVRIAGESARMNAAFIRIGLSACDVGVSYFLPRIVGASVASELLLTATSSTPRGPSASGSCRASCPTPSSRARRARWRPTCCGTRRSGSGSRRSA